MLGGVPIADVNIPTAPAHNDRATLLNARVAKGHRRDTISIVEGPLIAALFKNIRRHPSTMPKINSLLSRPVLRIQLQHAREKPCCPSANKFCTKFGLKPARKTHMIGMVVGDDNASNRLASQRAIHQSAPNTPAPLRRKPRIDDRPTVAIIKGVNIHMIKRHR